jgi:hypothetical protein
MDMDVRVSIMAFANNKVSDKFCVDRWFILVRDQSYKLLRGIVVIRRTGL